MTFNPGGSSIVTGSTSSKISTPSIENTAALVANTEYSHTLPAGTKYFKFKARNEAVIKWTKVLGESATTYATVYPGYEYESPPFEIDTPITIYFQCSKNNTVIEWESWS